MRAAGAEVKLYIYVIHGFAALSSQRVSELFARCGFRPLNNMHSSVQYIDKVFYKLYSYFTYFTDGMDLSLKSTTKAGAGRSACTGWPHPELLFGSDPVQRLLQC